MAIVLIAFLVIGLALPVLPLPLHQGLGLSTFVVGLVAGSQFAAAVVSRIRAGQYSDSRGAKRTVVVGMLCAAASESFIITGAVSWGLALGGATIGTTLNDN